jgi:hypothetical protein
MIAEFAVEPIQVVCAVDAVHAAGATAVAVQTEGGHPGDDVGLVNEIGAARVAKAGAAGVGVVDSSRRNRRKPVLI